MSDYEFLLPYIIESEVLETHVIKPFYIELSNIHKIENVEFPDWKKLIVGF